MARILVVDDDKLSLQLFVETLAEEGYEVDGVSSGEEAMELIKRKGYEVVLADLKLPDINGIEMLRRIKEESPDTEVIIITAYGTVDSIVEAVRKGAFDFIVKPAKLSRISVAVKNAITKRTLKEGLREAIKKHQELYEMAVRDPLTGLYNQRYLRDLLKSEIATGGPLSLVMFDIDNFKAYNDTYGHLKGDQLLKEVARILENNKRSTDIVARYGGDEFTVVLPGTIKTNAVRFARRCVMEIENHHFEGEEALPSGKITMSGGIASFPEDALTPEELIGKADKACYQAKEMGRNRIVVYRGEEGMSRKSILIVEPEPSVRESLRLILQDEYEVETAESFEEAKRVLFKGKFALMIVDLIERDLTPLTGLMSRNREIPVIVVSSLRDPELIVSAMKIGVVDYMFKPFDVQALKDSVGKAIQKAMVNRTVVPDREGKAVVDTMLFRGYFYYLESICAFGRSVNSAYDMDSLAMRIIQSTMSALRVGQCMIFLPDGDEFVLKSYSPIHQTVQEILRVPRLHPIFQLMERERRVIFERELKRYLTEESSGIVSKLSELGVHLYAPMISGERLMGAIVVGDKLYGTEFVQGELDLLSTFALQGAWAAEMIMSRRRMEEMNRFLADLLDNLPSGVIATNSEGRILIFNSYAQKLTGFASNQVIGENISKLGEDLASTITRSLEMGKPQKRIETNITTADGRKVPIGMNISILNDHSGKKSGAAIVFADLFHVRRIESQRRLLDKLEIWAAVAAEVEHLFRNPLVSIKTFSQLLPKKYQDEEFRTKFYQLVNNDVDTISQIIEKFTALSHPLHLNKRPADLNLTVSKTISKLKKRMEKVELKEEYGEELDQISLDTNLFSKAIEYVLSNCLDNLDSDKRWISLKTTVLKDTWDGGKKAVIEVSYPVEDYVSPLKGAGTIQFAIAERIIAEHGGLIYMDEEEDNKIISIRIELPVGES